MSQEFSTSPYAEKRTLRFEGDFLPPWLHRRNIRFTDHGLGESFTGRANVARTARPFTIHGVASSRIPHLKFRPRRVLEYGSKTWDIHRPVPDEPDYHLGAMRIENRKVPRWVLLSWDDTEIGVFRRQRDRGLRAWRNLAPAARLLGRQYEFIIDHRIHGTLLRQWSLRGVRLKAHFTLAPKLQTHAELLAGAFVLMLAHPGS